MVLFLGLLPLLDTTERILVCFCVSWTLKEKPTGIGNITEKVTDNQILKNN